MARAGQVEGVEQAKVIAWAQRNLAQHPDLRWLYHCPNGGARNPVVAGQLKAMGVKRGVPDLQLPLHKWQTGPGTDILPTAKHGLAIEMKTSTGALTPEQRDWIAHLTAQGWLCTVCRSAQEAIDALAAYLAGAFERIALVESSPPASS